MWNNKITDYFIISVIASFLFLWGLPATIGLNFDSRSVLILIAPFIIKKIIEDWKLKNFYFLYLFLTISIFLIFHGLLLSETINFKFFLSISFFLYLFVAMYYYHNLVLEYKKTLIFFFIFVFFISIFVTYFTGFASNPEPVSCGAIKNYLPGKNDINSNYFALHFISSYEFLFQENSHFAMAAVPVILFSLFLIYEKRISALLSIIIYIFLFISILKMSATLISGLLISSLTLIIFEYKRINYFLSIILLLLSLILTYIFFQDVVCLQKINPKIENTNMLDRNSLAGSLFLKIDQNFNTNFMKQKSDQNFDSKDLNNNKIKTYNLDGRILTNETGSTTSAVFFHALNITFYAFLEKPFGWGFQRYEDAFLKYNLNNSNIPIDAIYKFNSQDGTNNFFKIITEFGIFGFILYLIIVFSLISKKISLENKFFLFPFLITQSLRGVGYFNAGFILILLILLFLQFKKESTVLNR